MTRLRVKGPREGYRRAGRVFGKDWTEVSPGELSDEKVTLLLEDERLVLQVSAGEGDWSPFPVEERRQAVEASRGRHVVVGDGSGEALAELDPEQLRFAELGRDLESAIFDNQDLLESLALWPVAEPARFFLDLANRLVESDGALDRARQDCGRVTAELEALKAAHPITPASDGPDGGGGDPAAPAEVPPAEEPKPAAAAGDDAKKPAPKPKSATGKKPAATKAS